MKLKEERRIFSGGEQGGEGGCGEQPKTVRKIKIG